MVYRKAYMLQQWLGVTQKTLCNIHGTNVGLRDPCITLDKCNDVFRQKAFCWARIVSNATSAYILLNSDDMTVSVRGMKRCPERCLQKYWRSCNVICNTDPTVHSWKWVYYVLCTVSVPTKGLLACLLACLSSVDELSHYRPSKSNVQRSRGKPRQK